MQLCDVSGECGVNQMCRNVIINRCLNLLYNKEVVQFCTVIFVT